MTAFKLVSATLFSSALASYSDSALSGGHVVSQKIRGGTETYTTLLPKDWLPKEIDTYCRETLRSGSFIAHVNKATADGISLEDFEPLKAFILRGKILTDREYVQRVDLEIRTQNARKEIRKQNMIQALESDPKEKAAHEKYLHDKRKASSQNGNWFGGNPQTFRKKLESIDYFAETGVDRDLYQIRTDRLSRINDRALEGTAETDLVEEPKVQRPKSVQRKRSPKPKSRSPSTSRTRSQSGAESVSSSYSTNTENSEAVENVDSEPQCLAEDVHKEADPRSKAVFPKTEQMKYKLHTFQHEKSLAYDTAEASSPRPHKNMTLERDASNDSFGV